MKKNGRPSKRTEAICEEICDRLSKGEPLAEICRSENMPCPTTVRTWAHNDKELSDAIACARENGEDIIAANLRHVARGAEGYSSGDTQRDKLIIDTDLKLLAKWNPKKYGEKTETNHTGEIGVTVKEIVLRHVE